MTNEFQNTLTITNDLGLHARAATLFVQIAAKFQAELIVERAGREVNGKSIMGLLTLVAAKGSQINLRAIGEDGEQQLAAIERLISGKFSEGH